MLGVELGEVEPLGEPVRMLELDFTAAEAPALVAAALGRPAAAVFCDAAPKLSGVREVDRAAQEELYEGALRVWQACLAPGGSVVLKGFPGPESDRFRKGLREAFPRVAEVRPAGKRATSKEFYWIAGPRAPLPRRYSERKPRLKSR